MPIKSLYLTQLIILFALTGCTLSSPPQLSSSRTVTNTASLEDTTASPPVPPVPTLPEPRYSGDLNSEQRNIRNDTELSLGVGQLRPQDLSSFDIRDWQNPQSLLGIGWLGKVKLPVYTQPGGQLQGWLANGWLLRHATSTEKLVPDERLFTTVDIAYKQTVNSLVVLDLRQDGWFKFRYAEPGTEDDGTAWAHLSHLRLSEIPLVVEPWEDWFANQLLFYVRDEGSHRLHVQPTTDSDVAIQLDEPYTLEPLSFQGDWMRVRLEMPAYYCDFSPTTDTDGQVYEGWLLWRTPEQGPLLWYASDC